MESGGKRSVHPGDVKLLNDARSAISYGFTQEESPWFVPFYVGTADPAFPGGLRLTLPKEMSQVEFEHLYQKLNDLHADWAPDPVGNHVFILNPTDVPHAEFLGKMGELIKGLPEDFVGKRDDIIWQDFRYQGEYLPVDWGKDPNGNGWLSRTSSERRSAVQEWGDVVRSSHARLNSVWAEKLEGSQADAPGTEGGQPGQSGPGQGPLAQFVQAPARPSGTYYPSDNPNLPGPVRERLRAEEFRSGIRAPQQGEAVYLGPDGRMAQAVTEPPPPPPSHEPTPEQPLGRASQPQPGAPLPNPDPPGEVFRRTNIPDSQVVFTARAGAEEMARDPELAANRGLWTKRMLERFGPNVGETLARSHPLAQDILLDQNGVYDPRGSFKRVMDSVALGFNSAIKSSIAATKALDRHVLAVTRKRRKTAKNRTTERG